MVWSGFLGVPRVSRPRTAYIVERCAPQASAGTRSRPHLIRNPRVATCVIVGMPLAGRRIAAKLPGVVELG